MTALVVLPGLDGTATLHADFVASAHPAFDSVSIVAYPPDKLLGYTELETLVRAQLPITTPFVLLGESFSGPIALSIAADPPPNLLGLVLSTTFARSPIPLLRPFASLTRAAPVRSLPALVLSWLLLGRWATPKMVTSLKKALSAVSPEVLRFRAAEAIRADVTGHLSSISMPVLYLRSSHDRLLSEASTRHLVSALPHCTTVDVIGSHLLLQTAPIDCADAVAAFSKNLV